MNNKISTAWVIVGIVLMGVAVWWYAGSVSNRSNPKAQTPSIIGSIDLYCQSNFNTDNNNLDECGTMQTPILLQTKESGNVSGAIAIPSNILCRRSGNDCIGLQENQINTVALCDAYQNANKGPLCDSSTNSVAGNAVAATFCAYGSSTQLQCVSKAILINGNPADPIRACGLNTFTADRCAARYTTPVQSFCVWNNNAPGQKCLPNPTISCNQTVVDSINNLPDMTQKILTCQAHNCQVDGNSLAAPCGLPGGNQTGQQSVTDLVSAITTLINNAQQNANGVLQELIALKALLERLNN